jgi:hypothetical protein
MGFSFTHWLSAESAALGHSISSFATGTADLAKYGLKTVVGAPQGIVHEVNTGIISVSQIGAGAFGVGAKEAGQAWAVGVKEGSLAVQGVAKSASAGVQGIGSSLSWPLAAAAAVVGALYILKR